MLEFFTAVFAFASSGWFRPLLIGVLLYGLWIGMTRAGLPARERWMTLIAVTVPMLAWLALVLELAQADVFKPGVFTIPAIPFAVVIPLAIALPLLVRSRNVAAALDAIPPSWLVGLQAYRVLGGVFLVRWAAGQLPGEFALPAGTGDLLVGLLALPVAFWVHARTRAGIAAGYAWNVLGIFDLMVALTMGFLTSPTRFQMFAFDLPNTGVGTYPLVMIPAFAVPLSLILHGLSIWQLRRTRAYNEARFA